jgi:AcrR family transcriptional regulator
MRTCLVLHHLTSETEENAKRRQIIAGARTVFLSQGFDAASMGGIAKAAGVSKGTLYFYFKDKDELFKAIVEIESVSQAEAIFKFDATDADVESALTRVGVAFVQKLCDPDRHSSIRAVIAIADRMPSIGRMFYEGGPGVGIAKMREYLAASRRWPPGYSRLRSRGGTAYGFLPLHAVRAVVPQLCLAATAGADRIRSRPCREDLHGGLRQAVKRRHSRQWGTESTSATPTAAVRYSARGWLACAFQEPQRCTSARVRKK